MNKDRPNLKLKLVALSLDLSEYQRGFGGRFVNPSHWHKKHNKIIGVYIDIIREITSNGNCKKLYEFEKLLVSKLREAFDEYFGDDWLKDLSDAERDIIKQFGIKKPS